MLRTPFIAVLALLPSVALAFHDRLACGDCHTPASAAGSSRVVRGGDETQLCLECHGGRLLDASAVMHGGVLGLAGRPAGGLSRVGDGSAAPGGYGEDTGHTIGSRATPPGFDGAWTGTLTCKSCHAVHANGMYRNLGPDPFITDPAYRAFAARIYGASALPRAERVATASPGDAVPGADVLEPDPALTPDPANGPVLATNGGRNAMDRFCASCHPLFHGEANTRPGGAWGAFVRHPTSGIALAGSTADALGRAAQPPRVSWRDERTAEVACLTCHRGHGSRHPFGLVWWDRDAAQNGEDGAGRRVESLCLTCHRVDEDDRVVSARAARAPFASLPPATTSR